MQHGAPRDIAGWPRVTESNGLCGLSCGGAELPKAKFGDGGGMLAMQEQKEYRTSVRSWRRRSPAGRAAVVWAWSQLCGHEGGEVWPPSNQLAKQASHPNEDQLSHICQKLATGEG